MDESTEHWLPVVGYEGYYEVSDHGRVRSVERWVRCGPGKGTKLNPCRLRKVQLRPKDKRNVVSLWRDRNVELRPVYQLVLEAFVGPRPLGHVGCHNDGDSSNDYLSNLRWDTPSSNQLDAVKHGTHSQSSKTHCPRGHRLVEPNLAAHRAKKGQRLCRVCTAANRQRLRVISTGRPFDFDQNVAHQYERIMKEAR